MHTSVSSHTRVRRRDRDVKSALKTEKERPCVCGGHRSGACQPFSRQQMMSQMGKLKPKKAPGLGDVCAEHVKHLGPIAQEVLLRLVNLSWSTAAVPSIWRRATIIPIPKAGKGPHEVTSYRPICLTSHVNKVAERMVEARLTHLLGRDNAIPTEQVGFRPRRSPTWMGGRVEPAAPGRMPVRQQDSCQIRA